MLLIYLLVFAGFCNAADTSFIRLNNLINSEKIVKIDCYIGWQSTDVREIGDLGGYLTEGSEFFSIDNEDLLNEFNLIFNRRSFVKKRILVFPKSRLYHVFVIVFSDRSQLTLINSSGFGEDQFVIGEIFDKENKPKVREIEIFMRFDNDEKMVSLSLQGFQKSDFFRRLVEAAEAKTR